MLVSTLVSLTLSAPLVPQSQVIPASFAGVEADSSTNQPFGLSTACRVQCLYGAVETGLAGPVTIRSLDVRSDGTITNPAKGNVDLQVTLSTTRVTLGTASSTFTANHGADAAVVYTRKPTSLAATVPSTPVGQFAGAFLLDSPFPYDPGAGNLLVDFDVAGQPAGAWTVDTPFTTTGVHADVGAACGGLAATSSGGALGTRLTLGMTGGLANGPAVVLIGCELFPFAVRVPGNPTCHLYNYSPFQVPVGLTSAGTGTLNLDVPPLALLRDGIVFSQWATLSPTMRADTTQTRRSTVLSWVVLRVSNPTSNLAATGTMQDHVGAVIRLGL